MAQTMGSLSGYFVQQHREADDCWGEVERVCGGTDTQAVNACLKAFDQSVRAHLRLEEEILFPEFERATGMRHGPTMVMMMEHEQLRAVLSQMEAAATAGNRDELLDLGDTFNTLVQQHNMKEEHMLYRMCDQALSGVWPAMYERIQALRQQQ